MVWYKCYFAWIKAAGTLQSVEMQAEAELFIVFEIMKQDGKVNMLLDKPCNISTGEHMLEVAIKTEMTVYRPEVLTDRSL